MIDVALAGINSFASRGKRLRQSEYILDKPCSQNQEDADFRKYIASKIAKKTCRRDTNLRTSSRMEMLFFSLKLIYPSADIIIQNIILAYNS
jgi:hypothetical protein